MLSFYFSFIFLLVGLYGKELLRRENNQILDLSCLFPRMVIFFSPKLVRAG